MCHDLHNLKCLCPPPLKVKRGLSDMGDDEAVEAVEAFEVKYARLKERYKQLEAAAGDEADDLAAQLADAQAELEQLRRARPNGTGVQGARGVGGANSTEITSLKEENERLVGQLVSKQMEFAMLSEEQVRASCLKLSRSSLCEEQVMQVC